MLSRHENRVQLALALVVGLLLLANLFTLILVALAPGGRAQRAPLLFTVFAVTLAISVPCIVLLPRWLLRPYRQLIGEARRAPVEAKPSGERGEAEFVLETFQAVVAQLREQKQELEKLGARASERAASAEMFSERIVASVPSGLVAFDRNGEATVVNAPARTLLAVEGHAEGEHFASLLRRAPELAAMIGNCLYSGELFRREEVMSEAANGARTRRLGVTVAPIDPRPTEGGARGALCLLTDITEIVQLRETVALKRNLESLGEMSAGLAHEFKNALAALHGYAQFLQQLDLDERAQSAVHHLLQEVRGLTQMVTAFLDFARPQPLAPELINIRALLDDCAHELQPLYAARHVTLHLEGDCADVPADETMLRQALLNLIRNAAEAIPDDDQDRRVSVRCARERDVNGGTTNAIVRVEDTGAGIPAADLQRIFIPFFTTKATGHGIGLALAHRVVTDHGGTLSATNAPHGGAVFTVRLPLTK